MDDIEDLLDCAEYGVLALSKGVTPYSVPVNFVRVDKFIYFHGSKNGRKMNYLRCNKNISFSVTKPYSIIPSYFSSKDGLACPATHFFKSVVIDGFADIELDKSEKIKALSALMKKLQSEGGYKSLDESIYKKAIDATEVVKIVPYNIKLKVKVGQKLPDSRYNLIIEHLSKRAEAIDLETIEVMKRYR